MPNQQNFEQRKFSVAIYDSKKEETTQTKPASFSKIHF